jgi:predicted ribosomally synthesized peptide with SipW-like signal peptide
MNKRILISLSIIGVVAAIAIGGTVAYFSDTETSAGNTFVAGTINLQVGDNDPTTWNFQVGDVKPGDKGAEEVLVKNIGGNKGYLHIAFANLINDDVDCPDPEADVDTTCGAEKIGELAENLDVIVYLDEVQDDNFDMDDDTLIYQGKVKGILQGDLFNYLLPSGVSKDLRIEWKLDSSVGNIVQTDKTGFDIVFELTQKTKDDLVGDWHFNENAGPVAFDSALEPANNGNLTNGPVWTTGRYNPALIFDGVDDYVNVGNDPSLQITSALTLEAWIKTPSYWNKQYPTVVSKANYSGSDWDGEYWIAIGRPYGGKVTFAFAPAGGNAIDHWSNSWLLPNTWYHIVATFDDSADKVRLYINGVLDKEYTETQKPAITDNPVRIGQGGNYDFQNTWFNGIIDEVRIYNRALSPAEILEHYQRGM